MSASIVAQDSSLLSRLDRAYFRAETWLTILSGIIILMAVLFSVINIVGRGVFNKPFNAYFDLMGQSVPLIAFFGIAYCQRLGGHIRMDLLVGALRGRALWVFEWFTSVLTFLVVMALGYGAWLHTQRALEIGDSTEDIGMPVWPIKAAIVLMFALLSGRLLLQSWGYGRLILDPTLTPIAVPVVETPEQQAEREAKAVSGAAVDSVEGA